MSALQQWITLSHKRKYVVFCAGGAQYIVYELGGKQHRITGLENSDDIETQARGRICLINTD